MPELESKQATTEIELRGAKADDALCLSVLAMQVFLDTYATSGIRPQVAREVLSMYSEARFLEFIAGHGHIEVAERNGHLVGFAEINVGVGHVLAPAGVPAELGRLYIQEPFASIGLGTRLLRRAEDVAVAAGATILWLTSWSGNQRAMAFYARRGYLDYGCTYFTFEDETFENRFFARELLNPGV